MGGGNKRRGEQSRAEERGGEERRGEEKRGEKSRGEERKREDQRRGLVFRVPLLNIEEKKRREKRSIPEIQPPVNHTQNHVFLLRNLLSALHHPHPKSITPPQQPICD